MNNLDFKKIDISTETIIAVTNWKLNINDLYEALPITHYIVVPKKRGRKKKEDKVDPNKDLPEGSIITLKYQKQVRGVDLKSSKKKEKDKQKKPFRNSITTVMMIDGKLINFKITKNGKFQLTGCKSVTHAELCLKYIWSYIQEMDDPKSLCEYEGDPTITFVIVMTNIDFSLGFNINRENLDNFIKDSTPYNSLFEGSVGYTGVNIKIPLKVPPDLTLKTLVFKNGKWKEGKKKYGEYIQSLPLKEQTKEMGKERWNTFLVFQSGKVIMTSMNIQIMGPFFNEFIRIIKNCRETIEEKLI